LKKVLFGIFALLVLAAAGYFYYYKYQQARPGIWQLVPGNAFMAYESQNTGDAWNNLTNKPLWTSLSAIPFFNRAQEDINYLDSLSGKDGSLDKIFRRYNFVASFHVTSSTDFDVIYFLDLSNDRNLSTIKLIKSQLVNGFNYSATTRNYQGIEITEIKKAGSNRKLSYCIYQQYLVASYTPFLTEDVIRNIQEGFEDTFGQRIADLQGMAKLDDDDGNLYFDFKEATKAFEILLNQEVDHEFDALAALARTSFLDIKITDNEILFNGKSFYPTGNPDYFLSTFEDQNPTDVTIDQYLPQRTATLLHFAFSDAEKWKDNVARYWTVNEEAQIDRLLDFETNYDFSFDWIDGEIGLATMASIEPDDPEKLMLVKAKNAGRAFNMLKDVTHKAALEHDDTVYFEEFGDRSIYQMPIENWPALLLGDMFGGFEHTYFTHVDDYIICGNGMNTVREYLADLENENTWGKSVRHSLFLENTLGESNFNLFVQTENSWNFLMHILNDKWRSVFQTYEQQIKSFDRLAYQVSNLDNSFYTSLAINHKKSSRRARRPSRFNRLKSTYTVGNITTRPHVVRNHNNGKWEVLVQDDRHILYLISNEGEILWGDSLTAPVVSDIHQVDYYKNGNLQYLFATPQKIFLLDRNGNHVEDFPIDVPQNVTLEYLNVVDYDNSKRYRFMGVDRGGDIYLYDKEKNNLQGWQPRELASGLVEPARHIRVKGGDCMLALQSNGILNVINRRGNMYDGFPVDLKAEILEGLFVKTGNDFASTGLTTITKDGEWITINLKGNVTHREQLYKPSTDCKFWLVPDVLEKTYIIVRQEFNNLTFMNSKGEVIFEKNMISSGELDVQYYYFNADTQLYIVTDKEQEFTYIFNSSGELLNLEPVESGHPVAVIYYGQEGVFHIYKCFQNNFSVLTAPI